MCTHKKYQPNCHDCRTRFLTRKEHTHRRPVEFKGRPKNGMYFGIELEVECGNSYPEEVLSKVKEHLTDVWEFKQDGSLSNRGANGIEFESQPVSLSWWLQGWSTELRENGVKDYLEWVKYLPQDCRSHDTTTCGLHIHVNRSALSTTAINKINYFVNRYQTQLEKLGRRKWNRYCQGGRLYFESTRSGHNNRYYALNLTNSETIEFRFFKGTLFVPTIKASISLVAAICEVVPCFSQRQIMEEDAWGMLMEAIVEGYSHTSKSMWATYLTPYLKKKGML